MKNRIKLHLMRKSLNIMNNTIYYIFYYIWCLLSPVSYISYLFSKKTKINRKKSCVGHMPELESISRKIYNELKGNNEFINHVEMAKKSTDQEGFLIDCIPYLSSSIKGDILKVGQKNRFILTLAQNFLGIKPNLNTISIYANVPRVGDREIGSKKWHRDGSTFLAADFMFAISDINDENGPFFYINPDDFGKNRNFKPKVKSGWESGGRFSTEEFNELGLKQEMINKFIGKSGSYIMLNTGEAFHKGGYCKSEIRILGRFVYSSSGYSTGNLNKYGILENKFKKLIFKLSNILNDLHEKSYRNILNLIKF